MSARFFDLAFDLACVTDGSGVVLHANDTWARCLGIEPADAVGQRIHSFVDLSDRAAIDDLLRGPGGANLDVRVRMSSAVGRDHETRWVEWRRHEARDDLLVLAGRDTTDQVTMLEELEDRFDLLARLVSDQEAVRADQHARIAGELHDSAVQHCVAALMVLDGVEHPVVPELTEVVRQALDSLRRVMLDFENQPHVTCDADELPAA